MSLTGAKDFGGNEMAKKENIRELWDIYQEAQMKADKKKEEYEKLQADADIFKGRLIKAIPDNEAVDGVMHKHFVKKNVSYSKALTAIVAKLVPKTKGAEVTAIIDSFTSESVTDKVELAK